MTAVGYVPGVTVRRTSLVPAIDTGGISVLAAQPGLLGTLGGTVSHGTFLNAATARYPAVVLGAVAAKTLGIDRVTPDTQVYLGGQYFTRDRHPVPGAARTGDRRGRTRRVPRRRTALLGLGGHPTELYLRVAARPGAGGDQRAAVHRQPGAARGRAGEHAVEHPGRAGTRGHRAHRAVPRPRRDSGRWWAAIGIANIMVISVLERRGEIGLRRALGATRWHVAAQFLTEAVLLSVLGGAIGVLLGAAATAGYAVSAGQPVVLPAVAVAGGLGIALGAGAIAGAYPSVKAAQLPPAEALRSA